MFLSEYVYKKFSRYFHPDRFKPARIPLGMYLVDHGAPFPQKVPLWRCFEVDNVGGWVGGGGFTVGTDCLFLFVYTFNYRTAGLERVALFKLKTNLLIWILLVVVTDTVKSVI